MIWHNFKLAARNIIKNKNSYLLNTVGLLIALTICFSTLFFVVFEHNFEKYKFNTKNVYLVHENDSRFGWPLDKIPIGLSNYLSKNVPGIKKVIKYQETHDFHIQIDENNVFKEWTFHFVDSNYMDITNKITIAGDCSLKKYNDLLLTKGMALKYFGTIDCIGKQITVHGSDNKSVLFTVSGVFEYPAPRKFRPPYNLVARLDIFEKLHHSFSYADDKQKIKTYLVLENNADQSTIVQLIKTYYTENVSKDYLEHKSIDLVTPKQIYFNNVGEKVNTAIIISLVILLIALVNFIIHNNARFWQRCKSVGICKLVGSKPINIFTQSFAESVIVNLVCVIFAFFLAIFILPHSKKYLNTAISIEALPLLVIFLYGLGITLVISFLTSLSSLFLSGSKPIKLISQQLNKGVKGKFVNSSLITLQIGVTSFLMILFFATTRQLKHVKNIDWGFDAEEVMYIRLEDELSPERFSDLITRIQNIESVINTSGCWHVPPAGDRFFIEHFGNNDETILIDRLSVGYSFLKTLGIGLKSGRDFNEKMDQNSQKIIVNQEFLNIKNITNPYDTLIELYEKSEAKQIIGVIDDYHMRGMNEKITPQFFELNPQQTRNLIAKISPDNVGETLEKIEYEFHEVFPKMSFQMGFIKDDIQNLYESQKNFNSLISYCMIISMLIASMGLFGFVLNEVNKRIKEVGIRKVNGAKVIELFNLLNHEFFILSLLGFVIASPLAWYFSDKWIENFAYKTEVSWWIFLMVAFMTFFIVFTTVSWQTWRAARRNPVEALRYE